ncbi:MAG: hypothetical protein KAG97_07895, partial [Victivallales bacterium]|nr:hypothetical protein [Victivallales bacterium]
MRILIVIDDLRGGGTENVLAARLSERTHGTDAMVVSLFPLANETLSVSPSSTQRESKAEPTSGSHPAPLPCRSVENRLKESGVETHSLNLTKRRYLSARRELRGIAKEFKPDAAICMRDVSRALFPAILAESTSRVAVFWDNPRIIRSLKYFPLEWFKLRSLGSAKLASYCSSAEIAAALCSTHGLKNVHVIPNCYDQKRYKFVDREIRPTSEPLKIVSIG